MPRKIRKFQEELKPDKGLNTLTQVWTVINYGATEISKIYLNKKDAEEVAEDMNKQYYDHSREINKDMTDEEFEKYYKSWLISRKIMVKTLAGAIDEIKESVYDSANEQGEEY